jgi:hypothetical protein
VKRKYYIPEAFISQSLLGQAGVYFTLVGLHSAFSSAATDTFRCKTLKGAAAPMEKGSSKSAILLSSSVHILESSENSSDT